MAKNITPADLFIGWSGSSINSIRKAKSLGMTNVVEIGSSHILFQKEILEKLSNIPYRELCSIEQKHIRESKEFAKKFMNKYNIFDILIMFLRSKLIILQ